MASSKPFLRTLVALFCAISLPVFAAQLKPDHPEKYVVQEGDTLWGISEKFLADPWLWPEIWQANNYIDNPHLIFPGDVVGLVYRKKVPGEGQPAANNAEPEMEVQLTVLERGEGSRTVKLTPTARITPIENAIPAVPLDAISSFMNNSRIVKSQELDAAPYVLSGEDQRLIAGGGGAVYARGFKGEPASGYGIFRKSQLYVDPDTNEVLGLEAKEIGMGTIASFDGDVAKVDMQSAREEVMIGDRLLPTEDRKLVTSFMPSTPEREVQGRMIAVMSGVNQIGQFNVVVINQGERDGIKEGNVLAIYKEGGVVLDRVTRTKVRLPAERAGILMVFRTFEKVSYALVLKAKRSLAVGDQVRNPDR
ncbi:MAG: LysM peptidoglycan-binding domain-containing protein [Oceanospirillaceae bacterium]|nr:LysM peptidoglycan-binding domain-containing protein [Oceanospirillaceae bacterium]MCP5334683.1 LysM peptidoglycan-binding domain-containing protein [Oceanospirillaceae bacterium]